MGLITPDPGLVFWSFITFSILVFILGKFAWKPILHALKAREETIQFSLEAAAKAKEDVANMEKAKTDMINEAKAERDDLIKSARELKDKMVDEAKSKAQGEADKIISSARIQLEHEKSEAIRELKEKVATLSVDIAGKLLEEELGTTEKQKSIIDRYLQEVNFN